MKVEIVFFLQIKKVAIAKKQSVSKNTATASLPEVSVHNFADAKTVSIND